MAVLHDYYCAACGLEAYDKFSDDPPECCGDVMKILFRPPNTFEWGGPRQYLHLRDEPFTSRSELNSWTKANGLSLRESSEKVGGARNDMYDGIGKTYSIKGVSKRSNPLADLPRRQ